MSGTANYREIVSAGEDHNGHLARRALLQMISQSVSQTKKLSSSPTTPTTGILPSSEDKAKWGVTGRQYVDGHIRGLAAN